MNTQNLKKWFLERKCASLGFIILLIFSAWVIFDRDDSKKFKIIENDEQLGEFLKNASEDDVNQYIADYKKAEARDNYGGNTPEETMRLFIDALKAGDTELAAKYFVLKKQRKMAEDFAMGKSNGSLKLLIGDLESIDHGSYHKDDDNRYEFVVLGTEGKWDGVVEFAYDLVKNPQTNKWKIESL